MLSNFNRHSFLKTVVLLLGIVMMVIGLHRGEALEILRKAIVICLECIGIG